MNQPFRRCLNWAFLLLVSMTMAAGCSAMPSAPPTKDYVTALQVAVELYRQGNPLTVSIEEDIPIQANDMIAVDTTGRALLRFSDHLLVELFRDTQMEIAEVALEPSDLVFVRLKQVVGHSRVELESIANARVVLDTDYATIIPRTGETKFAVCQAPGVTCTVTTKGETEVQAQGQVVTVREGEGTFILENQPPLPPTCVDLEAIRRWQDQLRSLADVPPLVEIVRASQGMPCPGSATASAIVEPTALSATLTATTELTSVVNGDRLWTNPIDMAVYGRVPAGEFIMGTDEGNDNEKPAHTVYLNEFWIMQTEVTNAQYAHCVEAGACTPPHNERWSLPAFADHPVTSVDWSQANDYAQWAGGRLPTEAEWEKAARGPDGRVYPWGNETPDRQRANYNFIIGFTMPVGSYLAGASPYGMLDMAGNAEEWVADWYAQDYYATSPERNPQGPENGELRVLRGGAFRQNPLDIRSSVRVNVSPAAIFATAGFRVARSATSD